MTIYSFFKKISKNSLALFLMMLFLFPYAVLAQVNPADLMEAHPELYDEDGMMIKQSARDAYLANPNETEDSTSGIERVLLDPVSLKEGQAAVCSDYYKFGSVEMHIVSDFNTYAPGDVATIKGNIKNDNSYPLIGLDIKARLIKNIPDPVSMRGEMMIVDEFNVADNITVDANKEYDVSYSHVLPMNALEGDYQVLLYAVEQKRFNLAGLSFTNDIIASQILFHVNGQVPEHTYLDQTQITVEDMPHNIMAFMTKHNAGNPVTVKIPLKNPTAVDRQMSITYNLYSWDTVNEKNKLDTLTEERLVPANSSVELAYTVEKTELPVYELSVTAESAIPDADNSVFSDKTISNIRFTVGQNSKTRINWMGVDQYPLKKGTEATLVTCFHNTSSIINPDNTRIETIVYDKNKIQIARTEFDGKTTPNIDAIIQKFTPTHNLTEFSVVSTLYDSKGSVLDKIEKNYDCKSINSDLCSGTNIFTWPIIGVLLVLIVGFVTLLYKRKTINDFSI